MSKGMIAAYRTHKSSKYWQHGTRFTDHKSSSSRLSRISRRVAFWFSFPSTVDRKKVLSQNLTFRSSIQLLFISRYFPSRRNGKEYN